VELRAAPLAKRQAVLRPDQWQPLLGRMLNPVLAVWSKPAKVVPSKSVAPAAAAMPAGQPKQATAVIQYSQGQAGV
jgi:hypothetical protein